MKHFSISRIDFTILVINGLDHFDMALYGFLAPLMAPFFFPGHDPLVQLILAYSVMATSLITKPLGVWLFGGILAPKSPLYALRLSLAGVSIMTIFYGCLPTYAQVGAWAPALLIAVRVLRGICSAGEHAIAKFYLLQKKNPHEGISFASLYESTTITGILAASALSAVGVMLSSPLAAWRICFIAAGVISLCFFILRFTDKKTEKQIVRQPIPTRHYIHTLRQKWRQVLCVSTTTGLSHLTYLFPFVLMNSLMPLIADVTFQDMLFLNTSLFIFDLALFLWFSRVLRHYAPAHIMLLAASILALSTPFLFSSLAGAPFWLITLVRIWIVFWGVMFACPLNIYQKNLFGEHPHVYVLCGFGNAIGASLLGKLFPSLFFALWHWTHSLLLLGAIFSLVAAACTFILMRSQRTLSAAHPSMPSS